MYCALQTSCGAFLALLAHQGGQIPSVPSRGGVVSRESPHCKVWARFGSTQVLLSYLRESTERWEESALLLASGVPDTTHGEDVPLLYFLYFLYHLESEVVKEYNNAQPYIA